MTNPIQEAYHAISSELYGEHERRVELSATTFIHAAPSVTGWQGRRMVRAQDVHVVTLRRQWKDVNGLPVKAVVLLTHRFVQDGLTLRTVPSKAFDIAMPKARCGHSPAFMNLARHGRLAEVAVMLNGAIDDIAQQKSHNLFGSPLMPYPAVRFPRLTAPAMLDTQFLRNDAAWCASGFYGGRMELSRPVIHRTYGDMETFAAVNGDDMVHELLQATWAKMQYHQGNHVFIPLRYLHPDQVQGQSLWLDMEPCLGLKQVNPAVGVWQELGVTDTASVTDAQLLSAVQKMRTTLGTLAGDADDHDLGVALFTPESPVEIRHRMQVCVCQTGYPSAEAFQWQLPNMAIDLWAVPQDVANLSRPLSREQRKRIMREKHAKGQRSDKKATRNAATSGNHN